jgi:hypothetical protein
VRPVAGRRGATSAATVIGAFVFDVPSLLTVIIN